MKNNNKSRIGHRGFYIALSLCVVAVFLTAYFVTTRNNEEPDMVNQTEHVATEPKTPVLPEVMSSATPTASATPTVTQKPAATKAPAKKAVQEASVKQANSEPASFIMPVEGEIAVAHTQDTLVYSKTYEDWRVHNGIDINCEKGTPVKAVADGKVEKVYTDPLKGIVIEISHGSVRSVYANLSTDNMVQVGSEVKAGDVISGVGDSGAFESKQQPHLHFELYQNDQPIDPASLLQV